MEGIPLKFGQNRVSNSRDISDMDKCCLGKCHIDSWLTEYGWSSERAKFQAPRMSKSTLKVCGWVVLGWGGVG